MRRFLYILFTFVSFSAFSQTIEGRITDAKGQAIPFASIGVKGHPEGTSSDESGHFKLNIPSGADMIVVSSVGYISRTIPVGRETEIGAITLEESMLGLNEVVVTGTQYETFLKASPVKVEVISSEFMMRNIAPTNLMDGLSLINGVQEVVACGVCFTNAISINGLPGQYTAVLMDGSPIYGNLAATYGLNGIPSSIIDRFEVIKGPSSTLYGSEAVAGVINIITRDPSDHPLLSVDVMGTSHLESFSNIAFAAGGEKLRGYVGFNHAYINKWEDENSDQFGDIVNLDRYSLFSKWDISRKSGLPFTISGKLYYEDRRNGVREFLEDRAYRDLRGSEEIYGESIYTYRAEIFGRYDLSSHWRIDYSMSRHKQDSYYGSSNYRADQTILFSNLRWESSLDQHRLMAGMTLRQENYDDNTIATGNEQVNEPANAFIPGIFLQDEWTAGKKLSLLSGLRIDHHSEHGLNYSPRLSIKYNPWTYTTLRLNSGTGFKVVNLFTEDHAFVTGQREVEIADELLPERSINLSLNINHVFTLGESQGMLDMDFFSTYFSNKIIPDYDTPGKIIYANSEGNAVSRGISFNLSQEWAGGLSYTLGLNLLDAFEDISGTRENIPFAPSWSSVATLNYRFSEPSITVAYTLNATGSMDLPVVYDLDENGQPVADPRPVRSSGFFIHNLQLTKDWASGFSAYAGVQNLFGYRQEVSPLTGYDDPNFNTGFSPWFDTSYAYSPLHGRELYLGLRFRLTNGE